MSKTPPWLTFAMSAAVIGLAVGAGAPAKSAVVSAASHYAMSASDAELAVIVELLGTASSPIDRRLAQTFVAGVGGEVQTVSVTAGARGVDPTVDADGLSVALTTLFNGQPDAVLGAAPVQGVEVLPSFGGPFSAPAVQQAFADFAPQGIVLEAGTEYALVFSAESFGDSFMVLGGQFGYADGALGGNQPSGDFSFSPIGDIFFDVRVDVVPEPASLAMSLLLAVGVGSGRRQRSSIGRSDSP